MTYIQSAVSCRWHCRDFGLVQSGLPFAIRSFLWLVKNWGGRGKGMGWVTRAPSAMAGEPESVTPLMSMSRVVQRQSADSSAEDEVSGMRNVSCPPSLRGWVLQSLWIYRSKILLSKRWLDNTSTTNLIAVQLHGDVSHLSHYFQHVDWHIRNIKSWLTKKWMLRKQQCCLRW